MHANPRSAWRPHRLWSASRPHTPGHVDHTFGRKSASHGQGRRGVGNSRTGGCSMSRPKHIHVIGIGGSAMAPPGGKLRGNGFLMAGADLGVYSPPSDLLEKLGNFFFLDFDVFPSQTFLYLLLVCELI